MFQDRTDAGEQLAGLLEREGVEIDVVLAIPRGALPLGRVVADRFDVPLDVVVASKIGAPGRPELAIGAAASDGSVWRNEDIIDHVDASEAYIDREAESEAAAAREKLARYRGEAQPPDLDGRRVVIVDDGVATGATMRACLRQARAAGAELVLAAVPVGPPDSLAELESDADAVYAVERPRQFRAVGAHYRSFPQVSDEEAMAYLGD
jgi:putative phosphoribosyl transferase